MCTSLIGLIAFIAIALAGLAIGTFKYNCMPYVQDEEEKKADENEAAMLKKNGYSEQSIREILKSLTYTGFKA